MVAWLNLLWSRRRHVHWVLADQVLMSGCNFLIAILYARFLGPAGFGLYALITVAQQYFVSMSASLIGNPLITAAPHLHDDKERKQLVQRSFAAQLLVSTGLGLLAAAGLTICVLTGAASFSALAVLGATASSFGLPMLEWFRKLCFLHRDGSSLFRFDASVYLPIVAMTLALEHYGELTLDAALVLWGVSSIAACLYAVRRLQLPCRLAGGRAFVLQHWRASRDFVVSFQVQWLGSQGIVYLAAPVVGAAGIGAYRSVAGLLGFTNALGATLDNMLPLRFAEVYRKGGDRELRKHAIRSGLALTGLLLLLLVPVAIFAREIVGFLLGEAYVGYSDILWVQGLYISILFASRWEIYHERARLITHRIAISAILGSIVSLVVVVSTTTALGPVGVAWSTVLGAAASLLYLSWSLSREARKD
jgi:O-antigen/teichoic acid export membrane protein